MASVFDRRRIVRVTTGLVVAGTGLAPNAFSTALAQDQDEPEKMEEVTPRRTPCAAFPRDAHLSASPQGLWDLSNQSDFRQRPSNPRLRTSCASTACLIAFC